MVFDFLYFLYLLCFPDPKTFREESKVPVLWPELGSSSHAPQRQCKQKEIGLPTFSGGAFRLPFCNPFANDFYCKTSCAATWNDVTSNGCHALNRVWMAAAT